MKRAIRVILALFAILVAAGLGVFFFLAPAWVEDALNGVVSPPPYQASDEARALHETLVVADLHADPLLWGRDLVERGTRGHVDIPRLAEGNVALQVFSVVTKSPRGLNIERNDDTTDDILPLGIAQRWPVNTWFSLKERALYQAARLSDMAFRSDGKFVLIRTKRDLKIFLERRRQEPEIVAGLLSLEGAHALEGDPENVDALFDAGYRMMSFAHFFDNEMAGSAHGVEKGGLTEKGRDLLKRMEAKGITVDLSHGSARQIEDVLALATRPLVVSHGGVKGTCDNNRNLSDEQLRAIARNGGLVGIGFWETAVCGAGAREIAAALLYAAGLIGVDHVALGSDFDGSVKEPFDATGIVQVTEALMGGGLPPQDIAEIMGGNQIRLLLENLPD
jgi:microsomal dipeptidase-like Zn-dependent dipeptidase